MTRDILVYSKDYTRQYITENLYAGDCGYRIVLRCAMDVSGAEVEGIVQRADGASVILGGRCEGMTAYCTLNAAALAVSGKWTARVRVIEDGSVITAAELEGFVTEELEESNNIAYDDRFPILTSMIQEVGSLKAAFGEYLPLYRGEITSSEEFQAIFTKNEWRAGWMWKFTRAIDADSLAGFVSDGTNATGRHFLSVEAGDMLIACLNHPDEAISPQNAIREDGKYYFGVLQGNIDGAVTSGGTTVASENIAVFDGTSGRIIKDGGAPVASVVKAQYIWYANKDAVASTSSPTAKIGALADFKAVNNIFVVMAAKSVAGAVIVPDISAATVDASTAAGSYTKFHNGDLLLYAGSALGQDLWRWIPQAEAKTDRDGLESAWDKTQVNKIPDLESSLSSLTASVNSGAKEVTSHTEAGMINWFTAEGIHYAALEAGNGANPLPDSEGLEYIVYVGKEFDGSKLTGNKFQLALHLKSGRRFYRCGSVSSGSSFGAYSWTEIETGAVEERVSALEKSLGGISLSVGENGILTISKED